jgi:serine/threonine protein kinase
MLEPHERIGDYEIIRELGHGGMGQVYLARNVISDRIEAIKVLLPDLANKGDLSTRFTREIKVLASLEHPNIAQLRTAFTSANQFVMVMEYVEGDTLAHRLQNGPFYPADALNYMQQVLSALSYAHGKGIIHRDIKPANMMLTPAGTVKLMDFGIARSTADMGMTATGATLGSLDYMSPEQVKAEQTDARSDLYSVGVSLYEMVTGTRMFAATSSFSVMEAHIKEIPRAPLEVQPGIPKALSDIILMAVAKDPAQRFQTADAFRNALSQVSAAAAAAAVPAAVSAPKLAPTPFPVQPPPMQQPSYQHPPAQQTRADTYQPTLYPPPQHTYVPSQTPYPPPVSQSPASQSNVTGYTGQSPQAAGGRRHLGWIVVAAIVVLVAVFGGTQVFLSHKNATVSSNVGQPIAASNQETRPIDQPDNSGGQPPVGGGGAGNGTMVSPPMNPSQPTPQPNVPHQPKPNHGGGGQTKDTPQTPQQSPEEIAAQKKLLEDMQTEYEQLDSRAQAVESSVGTLEQQMQQSGLGLRGDIVASRASLRTALGNAKQALQGADTDHARHYLDQAQREMEKLESFLGRR